MTVYASAALIRLVNAQSVIRILDAAERTVAGSAVSASTIDAPSTSHLIDGNLNAVERPHDA